VAPAMCGLWIAILIFGFKTGFLSAILALAIGFLAFLAALFAAFLSIAFLIF